MITIMIFGQNGCFAEHKLKILCKPRIVRNVCGLGANSLVVSICEIAWFDMADHKPRASSFACRPVYVAADPYDNWAVPFPIRFASFD